MVCLDRLREEWGGGGGFSEYVLPLMCVPVIAHPLASVPPSHQKCNTWPSSLFGQF